MILSANEKKPARGPWHAVALSVFGLLAVASSGCRTAPSTFLERPDSSDLRVVSYNVYWDKIFPDEDQQQAEKFIRVVKALDPDVLNLQEIRRDAADVVAVMNAALPLPNGKSWHAFKGYTNVIVSKYPLKMTADRTDPPGQRDLAMALVDLPDDRFAVDLYVLNNHFKCCGDTENDRQRQQQSDAVINWLRDAGTAGGAIDLPRGTPFVIVGDLNLVGGPQPLDTLVTGKIIDTDAYGEPVAPDWDESSLTDAHPRHNAAGTTDYTWRNDNGQWDPGRLDFVIYSDSVLEAVHRFVLNTTTMSADLLVETGLQPMDVTLDQEGKRYDHLPVVVDFRVGGLSD